LNATTKMCSKCSRELPFDMFHKSKSSKDGLFFCCKQCSKEYCKNNKERMRKCSKEHYEKNKEEKNRRSMERYKENRAEISLQRKRYYIEHKEEFSQRHKRWHEENKERLKSIYERNKKNVCQRVRRYYEENRDKKKESDRNYRERNPVRRRVNEQRREAMKLQLVATLTVEQWEFIKQEFGNRCSYCGKEKPLAQEHFIPLSKGGGYTAENIIPACNSCNSSKSATMFSQWYPRYKYYDKNREVKILSHLGYEKGTQQLSLSY